MGLRDQNRRVWFLLSTSGDRGRPHHPGAPLRGDTWGRDHPAGRPACRHPNREGTAGADDRASARSEPPPDGESRPGSVPGRVPRGTDRRSGRAARHRPTYGAATARDPHRRPPNGERFEPRGTAGARAAEARAALETATTGLATPRCGEAGSRRGPLSRESASDGWRGPPTGGGHTLGEGLTGPETRHGRTPLGAGRPTGTPRGWTPRRKLPRGFPRSGIVAPAHDLRCGRARPGRQPDPPCRIPR